MTDPQSTENYESFFNAIDDFLFVLDERGNIIDVNKTVLDRLEYPKNELVGQSILMVHPLERRDEAERIVGEMLAGSLQSCPVPIITKNLVQIPVETRITHGIWDGKPALFGVTKDISQLKLSEEKFSKLFTLNPSACGLSGLEDHKYIEVNDAFYQLLGFDQSEVIGKTPFDLNIFSHETADKILLKQDNNGKIVNVESVLHTKNGEIKHVLLSSENIFIQDEKYRFTIINDITERKKYEDALRDHENLLIGLTRATDCIMSDKKLTKKNISDALHELGQATSVDRVYIFEHLVGSNGSRGFMSQRYEWSRDNVQPQIDNPSLQNVPWDDMAPRWYDTFMSGGIISGNVIDFPQEERKVLDPQKIISILVLPIHVNNVFWGFIGFDDCSKEREWSTSEVGLLRSTANSFAVVIERMRAETITMVQIEQSEKMNSLMVGRELKMIELKNEIIALKKSREQ